MFRSTKKEDFEILVVDDDKVVALLHKNQLRCSKLGPAPLLFGNGKEALSYLRKKDQHNRHFLILLDLNMPILDGWSFLQLLEKDAMSANMYVVIVTSSINKADRIRSKNFRQVIGFCRKPMDPACIIHIKNLEPLRRFFQQDHLPASEKDF